MATRLAALLRDHGIPVWYSQAQLLGAQQWHDEIGEALQRCDWFLLLLSPAATRSQWVKRELLYALRSPRFENRILPVRSRPCDAAMLSWTLDAYQTVDFTASFELGARELLRTWGVGLAPR